MTERGRRTLVLLMMGFAGVLSSQLVARPDALGPPRVLAPGAWMGMNVRCAIPVERAGLGVACIDPHDGARAGWTAGDRITDDGQRGRMAPSRLALFDVPLDVNAASVEELASLPGIGPGLAARIARERPYADVDDVGRVPGIGPQRLRALRARLTTTPPTTPR